MNTVMTPRRTLATAGRVLRQFSHDPRSVALLLLAPSLFIGLFAWLFSGSEGFSIGSAARFWRSSPSS